MNTNISMLLCAAVTATNTFNIELFRKYLDTIHLDTEVSSVLSVPSHLSLGVCILFAKSSGLAADGELG